NALATLMSLPICSISIPLPPRSSPFPYTTLFRSPSGVSQNQWRQTKSAVVAVQLSSSSLKGEVCFSSRMGAVRVKVPGGKAAMRSEEHTSELQSRENLVCRLLLEKKNYTYLAVEI